jgi:class 3 adenylate cyclase
MASVGQARVGFVVGDAGIGKTRLLRELATLAAARGFAVHVGRASEGAAVPFQPIRQALATPLARARRGRRSSTLDTKVLARFLRGDVPRSFRGGSQSIVMASTRLASSIVGATLDLARDTPLLFAIDDLQWADPATLETFELLAFALADSVTAGQTIPLLVVAGLRPPEPEQRLARTLARLQRESVCDTLALAGLDDDEVAELLASLLGCRATHQMVEMSRQATAGNPLFLVELVRHLQRIDGLRRHGRFVALGPGVIDLPLPVDVRIAVRDRTIGLDEPSRELLTLGAVLGDPFELPTLRVVAGTERGSLDARLDAWIGASLVISDGTRVYFAHPLIRQGLLADIPAHRRMQLSLEIARGLATLPPSDDRRLEIAHHLMAARSMADPALVVESCSHAAELASGRHAWTAAARLYEAALDATGRLSPPPTDLVRSELHFRAGFAHYRDQDAGACLAQFEAAIAHARSAGKPVPLARALLGEVRARFTLVSVAYGERIETGELEAIIDEVAREEPVLAGFAWSEMAQVLWTARCPAEARVLAERGLAVGRRRRVPMLVAEAHRALSLISSQELDPQGALDHLEKGLTHARRGHETWIESQILQRRILPLLWLGKTDRIATAAAEAAASTQLIHDWGDHSLAHGGLTCLAVAQADFSAAERSLNETLRLLHRSGYPWAGPTALPAIALGRALCGMWSDAHAAVSLLEEPGKIFESPGADVVGMSFVIRQVLTAWESPSEREAVKERLEPIASQLAAGVRDDVYALGFAAAVVDGASLLGSSRLAEPIHDLLVRAHERGVVLTSGWVGLVSRLVGVTATQLARWEEAERWFELAAAESSERRLRTESLRTALAHAQMLGQRGAQTDANRALELLAVAVPQLRELGMRSLASEATQLAARLGTSASASGRASRSAHGRSATTMVTAAGPLLAIMFTDIEGSTSAYDRLGDAAGRAIVRAHDAIVREATRRCEGTVMKHTGDGASAAFPSVVAAVESAIAMQRAFARHTRRHPTRALRVRIGINVGEPLAEDGDLFGTAVNVAARVCARAKGGQILMTQAARQLVDAPGIRVRARGRATLRGLRSPVQLFQIVW